MTFHGMQPGAVTWKTPQLNAELSSQKLQGNLEIYKGIRIHIVILMQMYFSYIFL